MVKKEKNKKRFFKKQLVIKNTKKSEAPLVLLDPLVDFYHISDKQKKLKKERGQFFDFFTCSVYNELSERIKP